MVVASVWGQEECRDAVSGGKTAVWEDKGSGIEGGDGCTAM